MTAREVSGRVAGTCMTRIGPEPAKQASEIPIVAAARHVRHGHATSRFSHMSLKELLQFPEYGVHAAFLFDVEDARAFINEGFKT